MAWKLTTFACGAKQAQGDCLLRWRRQTAPRGLFLRAVLVYAAVFPVYVLQRLLESLAEREELDGSDETVPGLIDIFLPMHCSLRMLNVVTSFYVLKTRSRRRCPRVS